MKNNSISLNLKYVTIMIAMVILFDHFYPGKAIESTIASISADYQSYFNAAGNGHYAYTVETEEDQFYVSEAQGEMLEEGQLISYRISLLFKEVQTFQTDLVKGEKHSLSIFTGIMIPILAILVIMASFRYKKKISTLTFVMQVCLFGDLVFLMQ